MEKSSETLTTNKQNSCKMAMGKIILAFLSVAAVVRGQFQPQPSCLALDQNYAEFECNSMAAYQYNDYFLPNSVNSPTPQSAVQSARPYMSLYNNTQCDASIDELQQFMCITFFPPCVENQDGTLHPVNPVPPCQSWCEDLQMRCGGAMPASFFGQVPWVDCASIGATRPRQCWRYIAGGLYTRAHSSII